MRVGVIGAGAMGAAHVDNLARWVPGVRVTQIFDVDSERAKAVAEGVGGSAAATAEALIESAEVDAVLIAAPDPLHEPLTLACLAARQADPAGEADRQHGRGRSRRVVEAEVAGGRRLVQLGFMRHFDPAYLALREAVLGGCDRPGAGGPLRAPQPPPAPQSHRRERAVRLDDPRVRLRALAARRPAGGGDGLPGARRRGRAQGPAGRGARDRRRCRGHGRGLRQRPVRLRHPYRGGRHRSTVSLTPPYGVSVRRGLSETSGVDGRLVTTDGTLRYLDAYRIEVAAWIDSIRTGVPTGPMAWDGHLANVAAFAAIESLRAGGRVEVPREDRPALYS